jgi:hypothetical protein
MKPAEVIQVIRTTLLHRGVGTNENPLRVVTQYWSLDGELLWEVDPGSEAFEGITRCLHKDRT